MESTTFGLTGLKHVKAISNVTHELSHLQGVTGVTIKVEPQGISLLTITGTSVPAEEELREAVLAVGCELKPLAVA